MRVAGFAAVLTLWPLCALAEVEMTRDACIRGWQSFANATDQVERLRDIEPLVTSEGWCRIDRSIAELDDKDFGRLVWRATGVEEAIENRGFPEMLEAKFGGIDLVEAFGLQLPPDYVGAMGGLDFKATRDPESRDFQVENIVFDFGALGSATLSGQGSGIDLSGLDRMQMTWGALRLHELRMHLETTPALTEALKKGLLDDKARTNLPRMVSELPETSVSEETRAVLRSFVEDSQARKGTLEIIATSEAGLGAAQIMGAVMRPKDASSQDEGSRRMLEHLMMGVMLEARWSETE